MQYLLMIYTSEKAHATWSEAELQQEMADYFAFSDEVSKRGVLRAGEALHDTRSATTVRVRDGKTLTTDGPFAETHEQLGGYYQVECDDLDQAIAIAAMIPGAKNGSIEIRPVAVFG